MKSKRRDTENQLVEASGAISVREAGARGGHATLENQGTEFFKRIGKRGGQRTKELYGELLSEFGKRGGRPRRPNLDSAGEGSLEKKGDERSAPGSPSPA